MTEPRTTGTGGNISAVVLGLLAVVVIGWGVYETFAPAPAPRTQVSPSEARELIDTLHRPRIAPERIVACELIDTRSATQLALLPQPKIRQSECTWQHASIDRSVPRYELTVRIGASGASGEPLRIGAHDAVRTPRGTDGCTVALTLSAASDATVEVDGSTDACRSAKLYAEYLEPKLPLQR